MLEGELCVWLEKKVYRLQKGETATARAGQVHYFFNDSKTVPAVFQVKLTPAAPGFEQSVQIAYGLATDGLTNADSAPKNPYYLALVVTMSDTHLTGFLRLLDPVLDWLAKRAVAKGIDKELIARYCKY